jgi:hypothetical protein
VRPSESTIPQRLHTVRGLNDGTGMRTGPYYLHERALNSLMGMQSYQQVGRILSEATQELSVLGASQLEIGRPENAIQSFAYGRSTGALGKCA